ncbi:MAG TPA: HAD-IIIC family phosphatase, partial [Chthoniobacteraceae bacterium]|nr:HAD-IIIC family phosphatase [Chthoniobacteraceae bacterium]
WGRLTAATRAARGPDELLLLSSLRKKAHAKGIAKPGALQKVRLAITGGYSFFPFHDLLSHVCETEGVECELWVGEYDNYISEIMEETSGLYAFKPQVALVMPPEHRCRYPGSLSDPREAQQAEAGRVVNSLLELTGRLHNRTGANIILTNFILPARHDPGSYRTRTLGSDWSFRKWVNLELGLNAPPYLHVCDMEFLAHRRGGIEARDERAWFESKQPCSPALLADLAREVAHLIQSLLRAPRKVLALDLDNTLWGGVVADDGIEGIEIGDTSPRGEAYKAFQRYLLSLKQRGTLLAVCSKNDHARAAEAFEKHPEMVLKMGDFVSFKANWEPKSENLRQMAAELNLGLDSFVFVDDNPAEIEIVRQFAPAVATILLPPDPSDFVGVLQDCRMFEPKAITTEDVERTAQYQAEEQRKALFSSITDMDAYLASLEMEGIIAEFTPVDVPRLSQLINKSNQFNLTTRRRTEAEVTALMRDPDYACFSMRLKDRFGDHGLISIVIGKKNGATMEIDTWLMSCRVLKRQVEEEVLNELARLALAHGCTTLEGLYLPTPKNEMVRDFYARMGFALTRENQNERCFRLNLDAFRPIPTKIKITRRAYEPG